MAAFITFRNAQCQVEISNHSLDGSSTYHAGLPDTRGTEIWDMAAFNAQYPGYITVPIQCQPAIPPLPLPPPPSPPVPPGSNTSPPPVEGPITGSPPPDECGEGYAVESKYLDDQIEEDTQPNVIGMTPTYKHDLTSLEVKYTQQPYFQVRTGEKKSIIDAIHEGTGPGGLTLHPPELQDYHLFGSSFNPDSKWPSNISVSSLLLHNGANDITGTDPSTTMFAFGLPSLYLDTPVLGWYLKHDALTTDLVLTPTDDEAGDITPDGSTTPVFKVDADVHFTNKLTVDGLLDPTGTEYTKVATNPGGIAANTQWIATSDSRLRIGSNILAYKSEVPVNALLASNNLSDVASAPAAVATLIVGLASLGATPAHDDEFMMLDASISVAKAVTHENVVGQSVISSKHAYSGNNTTNVITLTGINRAVRITIKAWGLNRHAVEWMGDEATGSQQFRGYYNSNGWNFTLSAPAAGSSQTLTLTGSHADNNATGTTYDITVWGTPT